MVFVGYGAGVGIDKMDGILKNKSLDSEVIFTTFMPPFISRFMYIKGI